ncbi:MAG: thiamine-phosphate pyrophosphorylase [Spirochaetia bacterium]|nr:thiamine-phosphate pyrophosphorylase [Spirochaetia bacterium]
MALKGRNPLALIDANINRAKEGLRVIEDTSRFILVKKPTTKKIKNIRHSMDSAVRLIVPGYRALLESRNSAADVGRKTSGKSEFLRVSVDDILASNFKRVEESLRVLEEISKTIDTSAAAKFKELRYMAYEAEKEMVLSNEEN